MFHSKNHDYMESKKLVKRTSGLDQRIPLSILKLFMPQGIF